MPKIYTSPYDAQDIPPKAYCIRCEGELWGADAEEDAFGYVMCPECRAATGYQSKEQAWLEARKKGLGASDASCILGLNPWKSNVRLWEEKTGRVEAPDIGGKDVVRYGKEAEKPLRELFALDFPQYDVGYDEFKMELQPERPWLFATLDGRLTEYGDETPFPLIKRIGVLEIKTTEIQRSFDWKKWDGQVPPYYYTQILHQLLATGYDFAALKSQIKFRKDGDAQISTRHYWFERADCIDDMEYLLSKEEFFWDSVKNDKRPALILPEI